MVDSNELVQILVNTLDDNGRCHEANVIVIIM